MSENRSERRIRRRRATIGLDYGTHSTKVVHRFRHEDFGRILRVDEPADGFPLNAVPSDIREVNGKLFFGTNAVQMSGGDNYGSLKADLLAELDDEPELKERIDILTVSFLVWVLQSLYKREPNLKQDQPIIQISAPTAHAGQEKLKTRYLRLAHAVYNLAHQDTQLFTQGMVYQQGAELVRPLLNASIPPKSDRRFFVMPETIAPIVSLQEEPHLKPGIHLLTDIGASTTEMSVFLVNDATADNKIVAYADLTEVRGGNNLIGLAESKVGDSIRRLDEFLLATKRQANRVWEMGFRFDKASRTARTKWEELRIQLTGGGTKHKEIDSWFKSDVDPVKSWLHCDSRRSVGRHHPTTLRCESGFEDDDLSLFATANGLAIESQRWPRFFHEHEIEVLTGPSRTQTAKVPSYLEIG